ncbi:MAG: type III pantothenate kinase [Bacteroidia bacterium]|nr:MAG: type III pantothenate kinase [Bacteroidia bacterium]
MNLILDLGNTYGKIAVCDNKKVVEAATYEIITSREISYFHVRYSSLKGVIISSVVNYSREIIDYLRSLYTTCIELDHSTPIPLENRYLTPDTLGYDRIAAAVGAYTICPGKNVLVIDAGTAITYDIVTAKGEFLGGNISQGIEIRFKSLNKYTSRLPHLERPVETPPLVGSTTKEAIQSGIINGLLFEMDGFIDAISKEYPKLQVVLTGGDAKYFVGKLKNSIFVDPNLNLIGLNRILEHNADREI